MRSLRYAWRNLRRQPARTALGLLGIVSVGALLFDMLLLSNGLVRSFEQLLDEVGFDVRVTATRALPTLGVPIEGADAIVEALESLPEIDSIVPLAFFEALATDDPEGGTVVTVSLIGTRGDVRSNWTILAGEDLETSRGARPLLVDRRLADAFDLAPGDAFALRGTCSDRYSAHPWLDFTIAGIADFAFAANDGVAVAARLPDVGAACGFRGERAETPPVEVLLVASADGVPPDRTVAAIRRARPDLYPFSNADFLDRFRIGSYSYFQQISRLLTLITLGFAVLLITTLISVAVNQRLGEIAALRALGLTRGRVVADLVAEACVLTASGALIALPVGGLLAWWLDGILRDFPGLPARLHFFVWHPTALWIYLALMASTAVLSVLYPAWLLWRLPIAGTLRDEILS